MFDENVFDFLFCIKKIWLEFLIIVMSVQNIFMMVIKVLECGVYEYLLKFFDLKELVVVVGWVFFCLCSVFVGVQVVLENEDIFFVGCLQVMQEIYWVLVCFMLIDFIVMIMGEFGMGKELVVKVFYDYGKCW